MLETRTEPPPRQLPASQTATTVWQPPDWLVASRAEVARLSQLTEEERQLEWDALPDAEKAAFDEAFEQVMRNIAERRSRFRIYNPPSK